MDLWLYDIARRALSKFTFDAASDSNPVWSPDGTRIAFASNRDGIVSSNIFIKRVDGSAEVQRLQLNGKYQLPFAFSRDGKTLIYGAGETFNERDLYTITLEDGAKPEPFLATQFYEWHAALSPDGEWLAYVSDESGRKEVYMRPFPKASGKWQVSSGGGIAPVWSPSGTEIFFQGDKMMMAATLNMAAGIPQIAEPIELFPLPTGFIVGPEYDISPDGEHFALVQGEGGDEGQQAERSHLRFVLNWFSELEAKIPRGK
jgi:Tol biopolymer transport system component